jgi:hypothetical protein
MPIRGREPQLLLQSVHRRHFQPEIECTASTSREGSHAFAGPGDGNTATAYGDNSSAGAFGGDGNTATANGDASLAFAVAVTATPPSVDPAAQGTLRRPLVEGHRVAFRLRIDPPTVDPKLRLRILHSPLRPLTTRPGGTSRVRRRDTRSAGGFLRDRSAS